MKFCTDHWEKLKQAVRDKGLYEFVSKSGQEAYERTKKELTGEVSVPDPLMSAHNMIVAAALKDGGLYIMGEDEHGNEYCPLCEAKKNGDENNMPDLDSDWINGSTEDVLNQFRKRGLMSKN